MVGTLVFTRLSSADLLQNLKCFAETYSDESRSFCGFPIIAIDNVCNKDMLIIVAVRTELQADMVNKLNEIGLCNYITVSDELFAEMSKAYIKEFNKNNTYSKEHYDILMMSSDNNKASGAFLCMVDICIELRKMGIMSLIVLPVYGDGELTLADNELDYTYVESEHWCIELGDSAGVKNIDINEKAIEEIEILIRKFTVSILHCNSIYTYVGAVAAKRVHIPFVWHIREILAVQGMKFLKEEYARNVIREAQRIICVSEYIADSYDWIPKRLISVIYDGVDVSEFYCQRSILTNSCIRVLIVGAIAKHKGQHLALSALRELMERRFGDVELTLVGKEDYQYVEELRNIAKDLNVNEHLIFKGFHGNVKDDYKEADIVLMTSHGEPFGRVSVEGMLSGCLVIGSNSGATAEILKDGETGFLFDDNDYLSLTECIVKVVGDKEKSCEIAVAGQKYARKMFTKTKNALAIVAVYNEICERNGICKL